MGERKPLMHKEDGENCSWDWSIGRGDEKRDGDRCGALQGGIPPLEALWLEVWQWRGSRNEGGSPHRRPLPHCPGGGGVTFPEEQWE